MFKIHLPSHTLSLRKTVYLHGPLPPHPNAKSKNENDGKTTAMTIALDFLKVSIAVFKEVRKKNLPNTKNLYTTTLNNI